jgi:nickel/cobalt exporter
MNRRWRCWAAAALAGIALLASAGMVSAHPLGNYTVNRAVAVTIGLDVVAIRYVIDMAEIPAFSEIQGIDRDGNGHTDRSELAAYASSACEAVGSAVDLRVDGAALPLTSQAEPQLSFPAGAGGLSTLRLVCSLAAPLPADAAARTMEVTDSTDDGHVGWREVTIAGSPGVVISTSDVPSVSSSAELTKYPLNALQTPPDVRAGTATFRTSDTGAGQGPATAPVTPTRRSTADDPLAALVGGDLTPLAAAGALLLALALGAAHAISPGHGKTLVAAYLIGSQGSMRHAATLGVTVAATHTAGVFVLGAATLLIGQFFVPERVIDWLSIGSGVLVVLLGAGLVIRALRHASVATAAGHDHPHPHPHEHRHPHEHPHDQSHRTGELRRRNVVALGLAGGMVPSASALIVLLVAVTTGRLVFGMLLIVAFGAGMALVLGGLAIVTTLIRSTVRAPSGMATHPFAQSLARLVPLVSGLAVTAAGLSVTIGAIARFA